MTPTERALLKAIGEFLLTNAGPARQALEDALNDIEQEDLAATKAAADKFRDPSDPPLR